LNKTNEMNPKSCEMSAEYAEFEQRDSYPRAHTTGVSEPPITPPATTEIATEISELLTAATVARLLGVHRSTVYRMLASGQLPIQQFKVGHEVRLSRRQLFAWLDGTFMSRVEEHDVVPAVGPIVPSPLRLQPRGRSLQGSGRTR
jgi:excisionase family DNA binding protein